MGKEGMRVWVGYLWEKQLEWRSRVERMERAVLGYIAACMIFGVISFRSGQIGSRRELCSCREV